MSAPVLLYHRVADGVDSPLCLSRDRFARQMAWLRARGFTAVTAGALVPAGRLPRKPVVIAFDDGYADTHDVAAPILARMGFAATLFVVAGAVGSAAPPAWAAGPLCSWEQIRALAAAGWEVGSHTRTHPDLGALPRDALHREVAGSRAMLEDRLGRQVVAFSYPFGRWTPAVRREVEAAGYRVGVCITGSPRDRLCLFASMVTAADRPAAFALKTTRAYGRIRSSPLVRGLVRRPRWARRPAGSPA